MEEGIEAEDGFGEEEDFEEEDGFLADDFEEIAEELEETSAE